jgi:hypothetical protein
MQHFVRDGESHCFFTKRGNAMQLCYRGALYDYNPPQLSPSEVKLTGLYRGAVWQSQRFAPVDFRQAILILRYRGVAYITEKSWSSELLPASEQFSERLQQ